MEILHLVAPGPYGGLERVVHALATGQRRRGHAVHAALVLDNQAREKGHPLATALQHAGVEVHRVIAAGRDYAGERAAMGHICSRVRPQIVHSHGYRVDVLDAAVARARRIPIVTTVHGFTGGGWRNRLYERLQRLAFRRFDAVVVVSRPLVDRLTRSGVERHRIHLNPNAWVPTGPGLDRAAARRALGIPRRSVELGWAGRLSREKGADVLIDALLHLEDSSFRLSVLGDGAERERLRRRVERLGLEPRVRWHGAVPEAGTLFAAFDVFILSSRNEGTPVALLEAMAARVPIVATRVGGVPDMLSDREAMLVEPGAAQALAGAIEHALGDPAAARTRAAAAYRLLATRFAEDPWLDRYESIYERVTARHPSLHPGNRQWNPPLSV